MLSIYCEEFQKDWDKHLPLLAFAYNASTHKTTKLSLFKVIYGHDPRFLFEIGTRAAIYVGSALRAAATASEIEIHFKQIIDLVKKNTGLAQHKITLRTNKVKPNTVYRIEEKV
jgi:hypothetical protein